MRQLALHATAPLQPGVGQRQTHPGRKSYSREGESRERLKPPSDPVLLKVLAAGAEGQLVLKAAAAGIHGPF